MNGSDWIGRSSSSSTPQHHREARLDDGVSSSPRPLHDGVSRRKRARSFLSRRPRPPFYCCFTAKMLAIATLLLIFVVTLTQPLIMYAKQDGKQRELVVIDANGKNSARSLQDTSLSVPSRQRATTTMATTTTTSKAAPDSDENDEYSSEHALYGHLLGKSYQKHVRPVRNHHKPITVKVGMCVMMIEDLIERDQIMVMASCVKMIWTDDFLSWDPDKFGNITWMAISSDKIWLPDIAIVNSPEPHSLTRKVTNVDLTSDGGVGYFPSGRLITRCNIAISYFPFDRQNCEVRFESWIYPSQYLEIELYPGDEAVDIKEYYVNLHWTILGYRALPEKVDYDGKNFSCITFVFSLRRKSAFYFMYFIFPELMLALLQTLSHTLPVEHPGRMTMLTALFIGASVTHSGIAAHIPKSSDSMSLLQIYMAIVSVNLVFALINSFVMLYTVLRYPNKEPTIFHMTMSFFSIVWPERRGRSTKPMSCLPGSAKPVEDRSRGSKGASGHQKGNRQERHDLMRSYSKESSKERCEQSPMTIPEKLFANSSSGVFCNESSGHNNKASHSQNSPDSPTLYPGSWLLDPKQHRFGCHSNSQYGISADADPLKRYSPDPNRHLIKQSSDARYAHEIDTAVIIDSFDSAITVESERNHKSSQPLREIYVRPSFPHGNGPAFSRRHEPLNRKTSSYGGGSSTQYMNKAHCIEQKNTPKMTRRDYDDDDDKSDENGCALVLVSPTMSSHCGEQCATKRPLALTTAIPPPLNRDDSVDPWHPLDAQGNCTGCEDNKRHNKTGDHRGGNKTGGKGSEGTKTSEANDLRKRHRRNPLEVAPEEDDDNSSPGRRRQSTRTENSENNSEHHGSDSFKHRWLVYCVALDKSIMYVNGVFNVIIPITLFIILPWLNETLQMDNVQT